MIRELQEYENHLLAKKATDRLSEINEEDNIDFDQAAKLAGWGDVE